MANAVQIPQRRRALASLRKGVLSAPIRVLIYGTEKVGKAQPLDSLVLTPTGFIEMAHIVPGAEVVGSRGEAVRVTGVHPQGAKPVFRVRMTDGTETECCDDHLWSTTTVEGPTETRTLRQIRETLLHRGYPNHHVPMVHPVQFVRLTDALPIHPYLLGLLLGDGSLSGSTVTMHKPEQDVLARVAEFLPPEDDVTLYAGGDALRIRRRKLGAPRLHAVTWMALNDFGLIGTDSLTKFIPRLYLTASVDERIALLRGLCDTDGHVQRSGRSVEFATSSSQLKDDAVFLVRSLGGIVSLSERVPVYLHRGEKKNGALSHRLIINFPHGLCPVSSAKHQSKWRTAINAQNRSIESVEPVGNKECQCLTVDAADGLYVTDDFIVTHNSTFAAGAPNPVFIGADLGTARLDVARLEPSSWDEAVSWVEDIATETHDHKSIVIDPANWLEPLCWAKVVSLDSDGAKTIEDVGGGYKKGYTAALDHWRILLLALEKCWRRGMHIIITAHSQVKNFANPEGPAYDRFELAMNPQAAGVLKQWVDAVLFARLETFTKVDPRTKKAKGYSSGARVLHTQPCAAYDAGSRWKLPDEIDLSWDSFYAAVQAETGRGAELATQIAKLSDELGDAQIAKLSVDFVEKNRGNADRLAELANRLNIKLEDKKKEAVST